MTRSGGQAQAAHQRLREEYARLAAEYDTRWPLYIQRTIEPALAAIEPAGEESILDVGCGTGVLLDRLARQAGPEPASVLVGVDLSPPMLRQARARLGDAAWLIGGAATALPIASERIDTLVSTNTLHFAPSVKTALAEWWRVLKPGGRCVIVDWCGDGWSVKWMSRWLRLMGRAGQAPLTQRGLRERLAEIGFEPGNVSTLRVNWLWRVMQVVARKPA